MNFMRTILEVAVVAVAVSVFVGICMWVFPKYDVWASYFEMFKSGAKWQKQQFRKIENYQEEGWYSSGDDEYIYGISFEEPIKLPVEFYYKKKEE